MGSGSFAAETGTIEVLKGAVQPAIDDIGAALGDALEHPIGVQTALRAFLRPSDLVTLIISDMSRFWMRRIWSSRIWWHTFTSSAVSR